MKDKEKQIEEIEVTEKAVRKNQDNSGAFVDLLNQEQAELQKAMIEEMATDIKDSLVKHFGKTVLYPYIAQDLHNIGYRNCKDKVVLTEKEYLRTLRLKEKGSAMLFASEIINNVLPKVLYGHNQKALELSMAITNLFNETFKEIE